MTGLDLFALFVLIVLLAAAIVLWVILGMLPGRIASSRHHPQADAIKICGWAWSANDGYSQSYRLYLGLYQTYCEFRYTFTRFRN